ncbi:MAG: hypothetical protein MZV65_48800 [Chromatiales bacterium]|nr:hypothetical protein [Chromatiales bacterium]
MAFPYEAEDDAAVASDGAGVLQLENGVELAIQYPLGSGDCDPLDAVIVQAQRKLEPGGDGLVAPVFLVAPDRRRDREMRTD